MRPGMQMVVAISPIVKKLIVINVLIWLVFVLIMQNLFFPEELFLFRYFGLTPVSAVFDFWIWQFFSYMFLHSTNVFHVLFNMLLLWWLGSDLEFRWGGKFFLLYYMVCGVGAGVIYTICLLIYTYATGNQQPLLSPVVGASGAVFGLMLAYGMIFGERVIYFFMIFPMKAKYFVMILGAVEVLNLLSTGLKSDVANLAHLGGLVSGFLFLLFWTRYRGQFTKRKAKKKKSNLRLIVNNEEGKGDGPRYWN